MFIHFDRMYESDRHTPHDSIGRACAVVFRWSRVPWSKLKVTGSRTVMYRWIRVPWSRVKVTGSRTVMNCHVSVEQSALVKGQGHRVMNCHVSVDQSAWLLFRIEMETCLRLNKADVAARHRRSEVTVRSRRNCATRLNLTRLRLSRPH